MSDTIKHTVVAGETLFGIADKNGVTHAAIKAANPQIADINKISVGDIVFVPVPQSTGTGESNTTPSSTGAGANPTAPVRGLDANMSLAAAATCLKNKGFGFAMRYYSPKPANPKNLTLAEAHALVKAGLLLGVVFESAAKRSLDGHGAGVADAQIAHNSAVNKIGQPSNTPIYFAVDFDATPNEIPTIVEYFKGVHEGLAQANGGTSRYQVGVYGSGLTCSQLLANNLVTFCWLTESMGFNGSKQFRDQKRYNLLQIFVPPDGLNVCGISGDPNEMNPDPVKFPPGLFTI
jgi:Rv2525c-like, glycoside hydrolase-like domain/LysM domain